MSWTVLARPLYCLACGVLLRRRWWQRGPLAPVQLCSWADESARACSGRERGL